MDSLTWRGHFAGQRDGVTDGKLERLGPGDEEGLRFVQYLAGCFTCGGGRGKTEKNRSVLWPWKIGLFLRNEKLSFFSSVKAFHFLEILHSEKNS